MNTDWIMLLSKIEAGLYKDYLTDSLDTSDQSKWGEEYQHTNRAKTQAHNNAVRIIIGAFKYRFLEEINSLNNK